MRNNQVTIADIAKELGISKTTVSRVLSGTGRISAETRQKVMACVEAMDYRPNLLAKGLATSKTYNLGVVFPGDASQTEMPFFHNCLTGIAAKANEANYDVLVSVSSGQDTASLERVIKNNKVDGVILTRLLENDERVALLKNHKVPFVVIGSNESSDIVQVDSCNIQACSEFTQKLVDDGARFFIFICGNQDIVVNQQRLAGFEQAMEIKGIPETHYMIYKNINDAADVSSCLENFDGLQNITIVCADDFLCSHALTWLQERKISIPSDVQIASYYDSALLAQHNPSVSAINISAVNIGTKAADLIFTELRGDKVSARNYVNYEFHFRDSTCSH